MIRFMEISIDGCDQILNLDHIIKIVPQRLDTGGGAVIFFSDKDIAMITQPVYENLQRSLGAFKI